MNSLPFWGWSGPYNAANYAYNNDTHLEDGLAWVNRSIQNNKKREIFYIYNCFTLGIS